LKILTTILFLLILPYSFGQGNLSNDSLKGYWFFSYGVAIQMEVGDTLIFKDYRNEISLNYGTEFFDNGKYKTRKGDPLMMCGTMSTFERLIRGNRIKYMKGKWKLTIRDSVSYLTLKDSKLGKQTFQIIENKNKELVTVRVE